MRHIEKDLNSSLSKEAILRLAVSEKYDDDPRVRDIIRIIYHCRCAYCECKPEAGSSYEIEHFYPKGRGLYLQYEKEFRNLHYSCKACNTKKSTNNPDGKILSPNYRLNKNRKWYDTGPSEINTRIIYSLYNLKALPSDDGLGSSTIDILHLNKRPYLVECRIRCCHHVNSLLDAIFHLIQKYGRNQTDAKEKRKAIIILFGLLKSYIADDAEFLSMVLQNYGDQIRKLLKIWNKIK